MALRFAYTMLDDDRRLHIVNAAPKDDLDRVLRVPVVDVEGKPVADPETGLQLYRALREDEYRAFALANSIPTGAINVAEIPEDWVNPKDTANAPFRNALRLVGGGLDIDMSKARDIWRDRMRLARAPLLTALDIEYMRADEAGDVARKREVALQKQSLRDVTADPAIEAARTPDDLKAVWPPVLTRPGSS